MSSTFTSNTGIEKIADGEQSGLWGQTTNLNLDIVDRSLNGSSDIVLSGTTHTLTTSNGVLSDGQFAVLVFTGTPSGTNTVSIEPNTAQKLYFVRNSTAQTVILSQGSGSTVSIAPSTSRVVFTNGGGVGAAVSDITNTLAMGSVAISGGTIDGTTVGATTASSGAFTTLTASSTATLNTLSSSGATITGGTINGTVIGGVSAAAGTFTTATATTGNITTVNATTVDTTNLEVTNIKAKDGTASATIANSTGVLTVASSVLTTTDINGGTIDGATIGGASAAAGTFTNLEANGTIKLDGDYPVGTSNVALGAFSLIGNTTGSNNTASGSCALFSNTTGVNNIGIGVNAGRTGSTPAGICNITTESDYIVMGNDAHTCALIKVAWTATSDCRDKTCFKPLDHGLDFVRALKPTEYQFKKGGRDSVETDGKRRYGFLAQDILPLEGDAPVIISADNPEKLQYTESHLIPILVKAVQELTAEVDRLRAEMEELKNA